MRLLQAATDAKTGAAVAAATISTSAGEWFGWIPEDVGRLGVLVGAILSTTLVIFHIVKMFRENKESGLRQQETELRIKLLQQELNPPQE